VSINILCDHMKIGESLWILALIGGFLFTFGVLGVPTGIGAFLFFNVILGILYYARNYLVEKESLPESKDASLVINIFAFFYILLTLTYLYRLDSFVIAAVYSYHMMFLGFFVVLGMFPALLSILNPLTIFVHWMIFGINWFIELFKTGFSIFQINNAFAKAKFLMKFVIYTAASLVIFIVFATLLAQADPNFSRIITQILDYIDFSEIVVRTVFGTIAMILLAGLLRLITGTSILSSVGLSKEKAEEYLAKARTFIPTKNADSFLPLLITLPLLAIFALFVYVQFRYLFGVNLNEILTTYTVAQYARRGFVELLLAVIFSYPVIVWIVNHTRSEFAVPRMLNAGVLTGVIGMLFVMLYSAFTRISIYGELYGPSIRRNYVVIAILALSIALVAFAVVAAIKYVKPSFALIRSQFFGDFTVLAGLTVVIILSIVAIIPWSTVTLQQIKAYYNVTGNFDTYQIIELPLETKRETYLFANEVKSKNEKCAADARCPDFGADIVKLNAIKEKTSYQAAVNNSIFTRIFGTNFTGLLIETLPTENSIEFENALRTRLKNVSGSMAGNFHVALVENDFAGARLLYDPKMQPNDILRFKQGTYMLSVPGDISRVPMELDLDGMLGQADYRNDRYVTYSYLFKLFRERKQVQTTISNPDEKIVYDETGAIVNPNIRSNTLVHTVRVGLRNGRLVVVHSNIPLNYLPDAIKTASDDDGTQRLRDYGYDVYCKIPDAEYLFSTRKVTIEQGPREIDTRGCNFYHDVVDTLIPADFDVRK
jgi:hypothetical protein